MKKIATVFFCLMLAGGLALAANDGPSGIVSPSGGNPTNSSQAWGPGDTYHLVFLTSTKTNLAANQPIEYWNYHVNTVADTSILPGVPDVTWYVIGSTVEVDARDNAVVSAPVYLLDGTSLVATNYADMWDNTIGAAIKMDENAYADPSYTSLGERDVWTGSDGDGTVEEAMNRPSSQSWTTKKGICSTTSEHWIRNGNSGADESQSKRFYALSQLLTVGPFGTDTNPPTPTNMSFAIAPVGLTEESVEMQAAIASDLQSPPVTYYFENETTHDNSGWQASAYWVNEVTPRGVYKYRVKARDAVSNETAWSESLSSSPVLYGPNYVPAPSGMHPTSGEPWKIGDFYHLVFVTSTTRTLTGLNTIEDFNAYVNQVADSSSATGVAEVTWYILGSTRDVDAKDNCVISAPVYLMDGKTLFAVDAADFWDANVPQIGVAFREDGSFWSSPPSYGRCWTGTERPGVASGGNELDALDGTVHTSRYNGGGGNANWLDNDGTASSSSVYPFFAVSEPLEIMNPPPPSGTVLMIR